MILNDSQRMLVDASRRLLEKEWPIERVRDRSMVNDTRTDRRVTADLGWFSLLVPPELGGGSLSEDPLVDCILVARARGSALHPGNFVGTNVVASALAMLGPTKPMEAIVGQLISGETGATWAAGGTGSHTVPTSGVVARRVVGGAGYVLSGSKCAVPDASNSDWILVSALTDDGRATQFLLPSGTSGVRIIELDALDITRGYADIVFDDVTVSEAALLGGWGEAADLVEYQFQLAAVLTMAEMAGAMSADFALALEYAKARIAFGRPIGSFQSIKHLLADTSLLLEMSDAMLFAAARAFGRGEDEAAKVVSMAKAYISDAGIELAHNCFQVFGGVGFTWEHDQHLYLRRVTTDAMRYGDASFHRERLCQLAGL
ncbi:acyl-CoA dehydrogenase family protein [Mycolicibacterium setense]|uniref:acyl-CoA dehydrogenase family protein n=1 Tax=Mycolicibacterium setense TaxID=431269 RepID=UPI0010424467|nr:acyl-CoA dehydrogenase family protein [Mycolicibacterium setense]